MKQLLVNSTKCAGCLICQIICSYRHFNLYNPKKARLRISAKLPEEKFKVTVCDQCGECMKHCPANAIYKRKFAYLIDDSKCTNCGSCVTACKKGAIFVHPALDKPIKCDLCGLCAIYCPTGAINLVKG